MREGPPQRGVRRRELEDVSPCCKSRRALSPRTKTVYNPTSSAATVSSLAPRLCLCWGRAPPFPIDLRLSNFADKDIIPSRLQCMWVATQDYPASPGSLASQSLCLDLDAILSGDTEVGASSDICVNAVLVISVYSSDPDTADDDFPSCPPSETGSPVSASVSSCVVESPSHYVTPSEPVVLSAVSSVMISPNRVREDCTLVTRDTDPVFEVSPDTTGYVPATPPVPTPSAEIPSQTPALASPPPEAPISLDGMVLAIPMLPLPDGIMLVPVLASDNSSSWPERQLWREQHACVASPSRDLSREGPFATSDASSDTGGCLLITDVIQGCPYRMNRWIRPMWTRSTASS